MSESAIPTHTSRKFDEELDNLRNHVMRMGGLVEEQLAQALKAVISGDSELGLQVVSNDEKVNDLEIQIDQECARILATRSPAAGDLRFVFTVIKTITDLERMGDEAEKIGFLASRLATMEQPSNRYRELKALGHHVIDMVHKALDAFSRLDSAAAIDVVGLDQQIDDEYEAITRQCITFMMEDPRTIKRVMNAMWIARSLERIGDHSKNICEYIIYADQGTDIRHVDLVSAQHQVAEAAD